jgi:hypothetical protein
VSDKAAKISADGKLRFGRWRGTTVNATPTGYLEWILINNVDLDDGAVQALMREFLSRVRDVLGRYGLQHLLLAPPADAVGGAGIFRRAPGSESATGGA